MLPDNLRIAIHGPTALDVEVTDASGRPLHGITAVTITFRAQGICTVTVEWVDIDGEVVDGELPTGHRTYVVDLDAAVSATFCAIAVQDPAVA